MNKKGQVFDQLKWLFYSKIVIAEGALGIGIAGLVVTLVVVFLILANVKANTTVAADTNATAAVNTLTAAAATIPGFWRWVTNFHTWRVSIVVITAIGALLIGMVMMFRR